MYSIVIFVSELRSNGQNGMFPLLGGVPEMYFRRTFVMEDENGNVILLFFFRLLPAVL